MSSLFDAVAGARGSATTTREAFVELKSYRGRGPLRGYAGADTIEGAQEGAALKPSVGPTPIPPAEASAVIDFWHEAGSELWFAKDTDFDRRFRERFLSLHEAAARGELAGWLATPIGALALLLLLDQFPRNAFRGTPRMYASDAMAQEVASSAIDAGHDRAVQRGIARSSSIFRSAIRKT